MKMSRNVHRFCRGSSATPDVQGNAVFVSGGLKRGFSFQLTDVQNAAEFGALYDRYMITHVQMKFYLRVDPSAQGAATAIWPRMWYTTDYDDTAPDTIAEIRERPHYKEHVLNPARPLVVNIKPAINALTYRTALASGYAPKWKQWIDMAQLDVPHYGFKYAVDDFSNTNYILATEVRYWFTCKDVK